MGAGLQVRQVTPRGERAILIREGLLLKPYADVAGLLTIGCGHLLTRSELSSGKISIAGETVRWERGITTEQASALLRQDLDIAEEAVDRLLPGLPDHRFDAMVSLAFNIGVDAFARSTLVKKVRAGDLGAAPVQIRRWNRAAGRVVPGLIARRDEEAQQWEVAYA